MRLNAARAAQIVALAAVYFVSAKLGLKLAFVHASATAVWPPTGIALAALLVLGRGVWPGVLLGAFAANLSTAGNVWTSIAIACGNTLEGVVGAYLVERYARGRNAFERPLDVFRYAFLAGIAASAVAATVGVASLALGGFAPWGRFGAIWATWWLGDAGGAMNVAPLLILWARPSAADAVKRRPGEVAAFVAVLAGVAWLVAAPAGLRGRPVGFLSMPLLIWAAVRFGAPLASAAIVLRGALAIIATLKGFGFFARPDPNESLLLLQAFLCVDSTTVLALAAAITQLRRTEAELRAAHAGLEVKVAERTRDLKRSNEELEQYAYIVSHDLQEPLRKISGFIDLWSRTYRGKLDEKADHYVTLVIDGAERMSMLIRDLLAYSRVGRDATRGPVAAGDALRLALDDLAQAIEREGAEVVVGELPTVTADPIELRQLFTNLVGNAIKFHAERPPRVSVSCERREGEWLFQVRDNGIGIEPAHREQIFVLFQRLHPRHKFPGTGIGLAVCKKIVDRRGGRIWVDSKMGEGSVFSFTIPI